MPVPPDGTVNKYIATQGPLPNTCAHFWQAVWDHRLSLIIMLTTLTERGRVRRPFLIFSAFRYSSFRRSRVGGRALYERRNIELEGTFKVISSNLLLEAGKWSLEHLQKVPIKSRLRIETLDPNLSDFCWLGFTWVTCTNDSGLDLWLGPLSEMS